MLVDVSIINGLKRLERAGNRKVRRGQKLYEAVNNIANAIDEIITAAGLAHTGLPRGYVVGNVDRCAAMRGTHDAMLGAGKDWQMIHHLWLDGLALNDLGDLEPDELAGDSERLAFARDIADGLLDEIVQHIQAHTTMYEQAVHVLEASQQEMLRAK